MLLTLSWGDSPLFPLPWRHSLPSLDAFIPTDLSSPSLPSPGPSGPAEKLRGRATPGNLFWSPNSQDEPLGPAPSTQPSPLPPPAGTGKDMALDFPPGIGDQLAYTISLTVMEDGLGDDLSAAVRSLEYINT